MPDLTRLAQTKVLWMLFAATLLNTLAFPLLAAAFDVTFVDALSVPQEVREVIAQMSSSQQVAHAWITGTLDVTYPLVYGLFFAGSALCFFPGIGKWLALPILLAIPVDLAEGVVQILALTQQQDWLSAKAFLTPLKSALFLSGLLITVLGWGRWALSRMTA